MPIIDVIFKDYDGTILDTIPTESNREGYKLTGWIKEYTEDGYIVYTAHYEEITNENEKNNEDISLKFDFINILLNILNKIIEILKFKLT